MPNKESSTNFIAYDIRPSKQAERRILMDFLKCANEIGVAVSDSRYVGMGGTTFYDFHLMHRFLGINTMISLERDPKAYRRCAFNCPFDFINVSRRTAADFLLKDRDERKTIYWFDYDDGFSREITADIVSLGTRMKLGGFGFVTVYAGPTGALEDFSTEQRLEWFQDELGEFSVGLTVSDMANTEFHKTLIKVLVSAFKNAFAPRMDGVFQPLFQVLYKDSTLMATVGGIFCGPEQAPQVVARVKQDLPFLLNSPYRIRQLNLTERERVLFDKAVTKASLDSEEAERLRSLGFKEREFRAYRDLIRFHAALSRSNYLTAPILQKPFWRHFCDRIAFSRNMDRPLQWPCL